MPEDHSPDAHDRAHGEEDSPPWLSSVIRAFLICGLIIAVPLYVVVCGLLWLPFFARHLVIFTLQAISAGSHRRQRIADAAFALRSAVGAFPRGFRILIDGFLGPIEDEQRDLPQVTMFEPRIWLNAIVWYFISVAIYLVVTGNVPAAINGAKEAWKSAQSLFQ